MAFFQDVLHEDIRSTGRQRNSCTTYGQDHWRVGLVSLAGASGLCPSLARRACVPRWRVGLVSLAGASGLCPSLARRACVPRWRVGLVSLAGASGLCPSLARRACVPRWRVGLVSLAGASGLCLPSAFKISGDQPMAFERNPNAELAPQSTDIELTDEQVLQLSLLAPLRSELKTFLRKNPGSYVLRH